MIGNVIGNVIGIGIGIVIGNVIGIVIGNVIRIAPVIVAALGNGNDAVIVTDTVIDLRIAYASPLR